jgi:hypothetical protein
MPVVDGYTTSPWNRPKFDPGGTVVCRRALQREDGSGMYAVGDIINPARFQDARELYIYWDQGQVDTLPAPAEAPPAAKPQPQKAAPPRGR